MIIGFLTMLVMAYLLGLGILADAFLLLLSLLVAAFLFDVVIRLGLEGVEWIYYKEDKHDSG